MSRKVKDKKNYKMYNQTLYEVERVVQIRWVKNKQYCLIKWRGYDEKFNTWEPKDHITFCYNYEAPEDKDDPEYFEKVPTCTPTPHHYQTRTKNKPTEPSLRTTHPDEKQDPTQLEEHSVAPTNNYSLFPIEKPIKEVNKEMLEIRKKGDFQSITAPKEDLVCRVLELIGDKKGENRRGKVQTQDGRIIYVSEDVLKSRYPEKVIEYYEQQLKSRSIRCD